MDVGIALVEAYLRVNGYLTVSEFPVIAAGTHGSHRTVTDIDILAFRFAHACRIVPSEGKAARRDRYIDGAHEALGLEPDTPDMLIGEVKSGCAELNRGAADPAVLRAALMRFGCCDPTEAESVTSELARVGSAKTRLGHRVRRVVFGSSAPEGGIHGCRVILLQDVVDFLQAYIRRHWAVIRHADSKDPAFALLMLLEKARERSRMDRQLLQPRSVARRR